MTDNKGNIYTHTHTHTHTEYVILIAFPQQQLLRERASMLHSTYTVCRVHFQIEGGRRACNLGRFKR